MLARVKLFMREIEENHLDPSNVENIQRSCFVDGQLRDELDNYWTAVLYFNSLKDLGRSRSRVRQEVYESILSHTYLYTLTPALKNLIIAGLYSRVLEFTSRIDSSQIKTMLTMAQSRVHVENRDGMLRPTGNAKDLIFASNMISVGIDIERWNLMVMVGQPRSTSEYIQSSSRVARSTYGLVINLLNPQRIREHSLFENYIPFHRNFYKMVEPLSITPFTRPIIRHNILNNITNIFIDRIYNGNRYADAEFIADNMCTEMFEPRFAGHALMDELFVQAQRCVGEVRNNGNEYAQSLRTVSPELYVKIDGIDYDNNRNRRR